MTSKQKKLLITVVLVTAVVFGLSKVTTVDEIMDEIMMDEPVVEATTTKHQKEDAAPLSNDVEMMEAYSLCRQNNATLRDCVTTLGKKHVTAGFIFMNEKDNSAVAEYLTLGVGEDETSINYRDGTILLGGYDELLVLAREGQLPADMTALFEMPVELIWPAKPEGMEKAIEPAPTPMSDATPQTMTEPTAEPETEPMMGTVTPQPETKTMDVDPLQAVPPQ